MIPSLLRSIWYELVYGGKTYLYDLEVFVLKNMLASLDGRDKDNFFQQLSKLNLVQRSPDGKIVSLFEARDTYFKSWGDILLDNKNNYLLAYKMKVSGGFWPKKNLMVEIFVHKGRIGTIEYQGKMNWPKTQKKVPLAELDWSVCDGDELNIISSELLL